jgi:predicted small lipoprotein YifL
MIHEFEIGHYNLSMGMNKSILVRASSLVVCGGAISTVLLMVGCGQKGSLVLPNDPDFKQRATLPDIVKRQFPDLPGGNKPAQNAASSPESAASSSR